MIYLKIGSSDFVVYSRSPVFLEDKESDALVRVETKQFWDIIVMCPFVGEYILEGICLECIFEEFC